MYLINIPPLRERNEDIVPFAHHFLKIHAAKIEGYQKVGFSFCRPFVPIPLTG